jgi:hypothetical protein
MHARGYLRAFVTGTRDLKKDLVLSLHHNLAVVGLARLEHQLESLDESVFVETLSGLGFCGGSRTHDGVSFRENSVFRPGAER